MNAPAASPADLAARWADAERRDDADASRRSPTYDFTLVGPPGFVLARPAWLGRFRSGALHVDSLLAGMHLSPIAAPAMAAS